MNIYDYFIIISIGLIIGWAIGWINSKLLMKYSIDGKKETEDYMNKKYGKDWFKVNSEIEKL